MADLVAQFGLDDREFTRGLQRAEAASVSSAQRVFTRTSAIARRQADEQSKLARGIQTAYTKGWAAVEKAMMSTVAAGALVARSISEYAERFSHARGQVDRLNSSLDRFKLSLGRDLAGAGGGDILSGVIDRATRAREAASDLLAVMMRLAVGDSTAQALDHVEGVNAGRRNLEAMDVQAARAELLADERLAMRIRRAEAEGDQRAAATLRVRQRQREETRRIAGLDINDADKAALREESHAAIELAERRRIEDRIRKQAEREEADRFRAGAPASLARERLAVTMEADRLRAAGMEDIAAAVMGEFEIEQGVRGMRQGGASAEDIETFRRAEREMLDRQIAQEREAREARRSDRVEQIEHQQKLFRVGQLTRQGKLKEAEILRETLETERRIAEIRADDMLERAEKMRFVEAERRNLSETIESIQTRSRGRGVRTVDAGAVIDRITRSQVLGGPGSIAQRALTESQKQTRIQEEIRDRTGVTA